MGVFSDKRLLLSQGSQDLGELVELQNFSGRLGFGGSSLSGDLKRAINLLPAGGGELLDVSLQLGVLQVNEGSVLLDVDASVGLGNNVGDDCRTRAKKRVREVVNF